MVSDPDMTWMEGLRAIVHDAEVEHEAADVSIQLAKALRDGAANHPFIGLTLTRERAFELADDIETGAMIRLAGD